MKWCGSLEFETILLVILLNFHSELDKTEFEYF